MHAYLPDNSNFPIQLMDVAAIIVKSKILLQNIINFKRLGVKFKVKLGLELEIKIKSKTKLKFMKTTSCRENVHIPV